MITTPDSAGATAFRSAAKNIAAQCSILAARLREEQDGDAGNADQQ